MDDQEDSVPLIGVYDKEAVGVETDAYGFAPSTPPGRRPSSNLRSVLCFMAIVLVPSFLLSGIWSYQRMSSSLSNLLDPFALKPRLTYHDDGSFKLVVFSDFHFGEAENLGWGAEQDRKSVGVMRSMLASEKPDFVVINGDLITGDDTFKENSTSYLDMMLAPLIEASIPFATTFGNHDNHINISHYDELRHIQKIAPLAYVDACHSCGGAGGEANYFVPIYARKQDNKPSLFLWFFDSRGGIDSQAKALPDWVDETVADWLGSVTSAMNAKWHSYDHQSIVFSHIPPHRMIDLQQALNSTNEPGMNADRMGAGSSQSSLGEVGRDLVWWKAMNDHIPNIIATVHGHDHGNEWCARDPESQVVLCFNKHSGYGGYDSPGWGHGVRIFELTLGTPGARTYIKMENGTTHADVVLDSSYDPKPKPKPKPSSFKSPSSWDLKLAGDW
ncbi:Metallo-dependent phosphatase [Clavulina sp. PMI_390]|nr:Metallo-dependent phosphatase [Clavulina sp. PMI_390]